MLTFAIGSCQPTPDTDVESFQYMNTMRTLSTFLLGSALTVSTAFVNAQETTPHQDMHNAGQDLHTAGHETKQAAKDTGHATKKETKKGYNKTKAGTKKAYNKTKDTTKGAVEGAKEGAHQPE